MDGWMICFIAHTTKYFILFCSAQVRARILMTTQLFGRPVNVGFFCWLKSWWFGGVESNRAETSVGRTLLHLCCLFFVTVTSVLAHVAPVEVGICARCSIPGEVRRWQILVTHIPGILSGNEMFCSNWRRICPFLCERCHLWKHKEVSGRKKNKSHCHQHVFPVY